MPTLVEKFRAVFGRGPELVARAPGRIEFIGNHTDYNGGTVLGAAIDRGVEVAIAPRADRRWRWASDHFPGVVELPAGTCPKQTGVAAWVNYPLGVLDAMPGFGLAVPAGFDCLVGSNLPIGAGLSSSAAIEMASALAFLGLTQQTPSRETVVQLCRRAENHFVGVPCGILDQAIAGFGRKQHLVFIDCRGPRFATVPLPAGTQFWIFNTHTKHALIDGLYAARHAECMAAAQALGVDLLVDASSADLAAAGEKLSEVAAKRARHILDEIARVGATIEALEKGDRVAVGRLLTASHRSSQMLFENSTPELDFLVDSLVTQPEVHGARLTGGGFGGAVMALTTENFGETQARAVAENYRRRFGSVPAILHAQTADGASVETESCP